MILKTQHGKYGHDLGLSSVLSILDRHPRAFHAVMEAAESFDPVILKRINNVSPESKRLIVELATQPPTLRQIVRLYLRKFLQPHLHLKVPQLEIPTILHAYLLFEIS